MKVKKLSLAILLLAVTIIVYVVVSVLFCYTTKPATTSGEFSFAITYEYKGEIKTLSGVLKCEYSGSDTVLGEHSRYWHQETLYDNPENLEYPFIIEHSDERQITLSLNENMSAGYFMGDPLHKDYYEENGFDGVQPYVSYYDYKNDIVLEGETDGEVLESIDFQIIDCTYAEPIENSFSFSGIRYKADNIILFVAITLAFLLLCLIFVHKDTEYSYSKLDKFGIALNLIIGLVAVPVIYIVCSLFGLVESGVDIVDQIIYNIPPVAILCLTLSVAFRRKGFSKTGFLVQFGGLLPFAAILALEWILKIH